MLATFDFFLGTFKNCATKLINKKLAKSHENKIVKHKTNYVNKLEFIEMVVTNKRHDIFNDNSHVPNFAKNVKVQKKRGTLAMTLVSIPLKTLVPISPKAPLILSTLFKPSDSTYACAR